MDKVGFEVLTDQEWEEWIEEMAWLIVIQMGIEALDLVEMVDNQALDRNGIAEVILHYYLLSINKE